MLAGAFQLQDEKKTTNNVDGDDEDLTEQTLTDGCHGDEGEHTITSSMEMHDTNYVSLFIR